jgi:hypothetical protein
MIASVYIRAFKRNVVLPRVSHEAQSLGRGDVLRYEEAGVDALQVLEGLRGVALEGSPRLVRLGGEEPRHGAAQGGAVEIVGLQVPFR